MFNIDTSDKDDDPKTCSGGIGDNKASLYLYFNIIVYYLLY